MSYFEFWLPVYVKQYRNGSLEERKEIKKNIYNSIRLSEIEKDRIWNMIIK